MAPRRASERQSDSRIMLRFAGMGTELSAGVAGFTLIGYLIDRWAGTEPVALISLGVLGLIGGLANFIRQAFRIQRELDRSAARRSDDAPPDA